MGQSTVMGLSAPCTTARVTLPVPSQGVPTITGVKTARRVTTAVATLAFVAAAMLGLVPMRVRPVVYGLPPNPPTVSCGTVFGPSRWAGDDACEGAITDRGGLILVAVIIAVIAAAVAVGLLVRELR
jgi:hypothetical protein